MQEARHGGIRNRQQSRNGSAGRAPGQGAAQRLSLVLFTGGLGAGKTAFCEGIARGLGCTDEVSSPTFAIVNVYRGPQPFAHFDMYRISTMEDLQATGFFDYLDDGAVVAAEWSENVADAMQGAISVRIGRDSDEQRTITIEGGGLDANSGI